MSLRKKLSKLKLDLDEEQEAQRNKLVLDLLKGQMKTKIQKEISVKIKQRYQELAVKELNFETLTLYDHYMKEKGMCFYYSNRRKPAEVNLQDALDGKQVQKKQFSLQSHNASIEASTARLSKDLRDSSSQMDGTYLKKELSKAGFFKKENPSKSAMAIKPIKINFKKAGQIPSIFDKCGGRTAQVSPKHSPVGITGMKEKGDLGQLDQLIIRNLKESKDPHESTQSLLAGSVPDFKQIIEEYRKFQQLLHHRKTVASRKESQKKLPSSTRLFLAQEREREEGKRSVDHMRRFRQVVNTFKKWKERRKKQKGMVGVDMDVGEEIDILRREKQLRQGKIGRFSLDLDAFHQKERQRQDLEEKVMQSLVENQLDKMIEEMELFLKADSHEGEREPSFDEMKKVTSEVEERKEGLPGLSESRLLQMAVIDNIISDCSGFIESKPGISLEELESTIQKTNLELTKREWVVKKLLKVNEKAVNCQKQRELSEEIFRDQGDKERELLSSMKDYFSDQLKLEEEIYELNRKRAMRMKFEDKKFAKGRAKISTRLNKLKLPELGANYAR